MQGSLNLDDEVFLKASYVGPVEKQEFKGQGLHIVRLKMFPDCDQNNECQIKIVHESVIKNLKQEDK